MTALFNIDKNQLERIEDKIFSLGFIVVQIMLPIGLIMLVLLPFLTEFIFDTNNVEFGIFYLITIVLGSIMGGSATALAGLDDTIWHRLNRKLKVFGYK